MGSDSPYFLWDYDMPDHKIRQILSGDNTVEKHWLVSRILTHAHFEDVWKYLTLADVLTSWPHLALPTRTRHAWEQALSIWGYHV